MTTQEHKGKRLAAPGIVSFYPKPTVDLDLLLIYSNFWCGSGLRSQGRLGIGHPQESNGGKHNNIYRGIRCAWFEIQGEEIVRGVGQLLAASGLMLAGQIRKVRRLLCNIFFDVII